MTLAFNQVWLVLFEAEVHIVILGFATNTKPTRLQSRKQYPNEFSKGCRIQNCYTLCSASRYIICIHSTSRYGTFSFITNFIYPRRKGSSADKLLDESNHTT